MSRLVHYRTLGVISLFGFTLMLTPSEITKIHGLPVPERQKRYLELSSKVANLVVLTQIELEELVVLRDLLQANAQNLLTIGVIDPIEI